MNETKEALAEKTDKKHTVTLIVNARPKEWSEQHITFRELVVLQYGKFEDNPKHRIHRRFQQRPEAKPPRQYGGWRQGEGPGSDELQCHKN